MPGVLVVLLAFVSAAPPSSAPALVSVARIWDAGAHNGFTDLIRWRNRWYCTFREGDAHVGGDTSYAGMVWHEGLLWVSYDASHEGKTAAYLARVKLY